MVTSPEPGLIIKGVALLFLAAIAVGLFFMVVRLRHRPGVLALIFAVPLALVALYSFVPIVVPQPPATPVAEVRLASAVDDFERWQRMEVVGANAQPKPWVVNGWSSNGLILESGGAPQGRPPQNELVGYSGLEATPQAAIEGARRSAAERLKALVRDELSRRWKSTKAQVQPIEEAVGRLLADPGVEVDRYEESVRLPTSRATAHRAAVLVRMPQNWITVTAAQALEQAMTAEVQSRRTVLYTVISAVALALVIYCIYSFLNAGSKGHLAWPLRIASVAAYLLLCLGLLLLQGRFP